MRMRSRSLLSRRRMLRSRALSPVRLRLPCDNACAGEPRPRHLSLSALRAPPSLPELSESVTDRESVYYILVFAAYKYKNAISHNIRA